MVQCSWNQELAKKTFWRLCRALLFGLTCLVRYLTSGAFRAGTSRGFAMCTSRTKIAQPEMWAADWCERSHEGGETAETASKAGESLWRPAKRFKFNASEFCQHFEKLMPTREKLFMTWMMCVSFGSSLVQSEVQRLRGYVKMIGTQSQAGKPIPKACDTSTLHRSRIGQRCISALEKTKGETTGHDTAIHVAFSPGLRRCRPWGTMWLQQMATDMPTKLLCIKIWVIWKRSTAGKSHSGCKHIAAGRHTLQSYSEMAWPRFRQQHDSRALVLHKL